MPQTSCCMLRTFATYENRHFVRYKIVFSAPFFIRLLFFSKYRLRHILFSFVHGWVSHQAKPHVRRRDHKRTTRKQPQRRTISSCSREWNPPETDRKKTEWGQKRWCCTRQAQHCADRQTEMVSSYVNTRWASRINCYGTPTRPFWGC